MKSSASELGLITSFSRTSQSGFHSLHSTLAALIEATVIWAMDIDRGLLYAVVKPLRRKIF